MIRNAHLANWDYSQRRRTRKANGLISQTDGSWLVTTFERRDPHIYGRVRPGKGGRWRGVSYHGHGFRHFPGKGEAAAWVREVGEKFRATHREPLDLRAT